MAVSVTLERLFAPTVLTTGITTLFTTPAAIAPSRLNLLMNARIRCTNTSGGAANVTLYAVPSGGSPLASNAFANAETLAANTHADYDVPVLAGGDTLQALASVANAVTVTSLSGAIVAP